MVYSQGNEGTMREYPNFFEIDGQEAIIMSPIGMKPEGKKYLNFFQAGYMVGKLDYNTGVFTHGNLIRLIMVLFERNFNRNLFYSTFRLNEH